MSGSVEASFHAGPINAGNMTTIPCSQYTVAWNHDLGPASRRCR